MRVPLMGGRMHRAGLLAVPLLVVGCGTGSVARRMSASERLALAEETRDGGAGDRKPTMHSCWQEHCVVVAGKGLECRQVWNVKDCGPKPEDRPAVARDVP